MAPLKPRRDRPRIVVAMDSFKGSLDAPSACRAVTEGIREGYPPARVHVQPMADGGEGTAAVLREALGGRWMRVRVRGPMPGQCVEAAYVWVPQRRLAIIEMAQAAGYALVPPAKRNPELATTYGVGQLVLAALRRNPRAIWLTLGGSITVDGGVGLAMALGWRFEDASGQPLGPGGGELRRLARLVPPPERKFPPVLALCDVTNPLTGPRGAARVFGPQKGATPQMVERLEEGLRRMAAVVRRQLGVEIDAIPGAGAAGGLGGAAVAFLGARLVPGIEVVVRAVRLRTHVKGADRVITGEGRLDQTSLHGKVVSGVLSVARSAGARVVVFAGQVSLAPADWRAAGVEQALALVPTVAELPEALTHPFECLRTLAARWAREEFGTGSQPQSVPRAARTRSPCLRSPCGQTRGQ